MLYWLRACLELRNPGWLPTHLTPQLGWLERLAGLFYLSLYSFIPPPPPRLFSLHGNSPQKASCSSWLGVCFTPQNGSCKTSWDPELEISQCHFYHILWVRESHKTSLDLKGRVKNEFSWWKEQDMHISMGGMVGSHLCRQPATRGKSPSLEHDRKLFLKLKWGSIFLQGFSPPFHYF